MNITRKDLKKRIIEISYKHKLSHIGSCLTAVDIIDDIYSKKGLDERFVLSSGHAGLALYSVIEKYEGIDAEEILNHHGVHPDRCVECSLHCSTGSLGQGLPIAAGMALANRSSQVYCLVSDGECAEGSIMESLRIAMDQKLHNLKIYVNHNGYGAYKSYTYLEIYKLLLPYHDLNLEIVDTSFDYLPFLQGLDAHYHVMTDDEYKLAFEILS